MRSLTLGALSLVFLAGCSHTPVQAQATKLETNQQKASYAAGMALGEQVGKTLSKNDLDEDIFLKALTDQLKGNDPLLEAEEASVASDAYRQEITQRLEEERQQAMARNAAQGKAFMKENKQRSGVKTLPSGLQYEVLKESGSGATPGPKDAVLVNYTGTLLDGTFVESNLAQGEAVRVNMGVALRGWQQALKQMKEGEKWRIFVPPELAYGENGLRDKVPPQSTLIYELELVEVIDRS